MTDICRFPSFAAYSASKRGCTCNRCVEYVQNPPACKEPSYDPATAYSKFGCRCPRCVDGYNSKRRAHRPHRSEKAKQCENQASKAYAAEHTDRKTDAVRKWRKNNWDEYLVKAGHYHDKRRQKMKIRLEPDERKVLDSIRRLRNAMNKNAGFKKWTIDHILPISQGGFDHPENIRLMLMEDNQRRHYSYDDVDPAYIVYLRELGESRRIENNTFEDAVECPASTQT